MVSKFQADSDFLEDNVKRAKAENKVEIDALKDVAQTEKQLLKIQEANEVSSNDKTVKEVARCDVCNIGFGHKKSYKLHMRSKSHREKHQNRLQKNLSLKLLLL